MSSVIDKVFALEHIRQWIPSFGNLKEESVSLEKMTGITNQTFRFSHTQEEIEPKDVIFRVFGKTCEDTFIDRNDETIVYQAVSEVGLGPRMIGFDKDTRAEEFMYSSVLKQNQMNLPLFRRQVASALAEFHQIQITNISKVPMMKQVLTNDRVIRAVEDKIEKTELFTANEIQMIEEMKKVWFSRSEREQILSFFPKDDDSDQILFCHNDLLANNVLILEQDSSIKFIDFEYSQYNLRSFDIANYFNESQYDYSVSVEPFFAVSEESVDLSDYSDFVKHYVLAYLLTKHKISFDSKKLSQQFEETYFNQLLEQIDINTFNQQVTQLLELELPLGTCLSHFYWGIWALHMSKDPNICFDYVKFAYSRFNKYQEVKKQLIQNLSQQALPKSQ